MKHFNDSQQIQDADGGEDAAMSLELLEQQLAAAKDRLREMSADTNPVERAELQVSIGGTLVDLNQGEEGFAQAREAFDAFVEAQHWDGAVQACDVMFQADQPESLAALGQGVWLAVTFPVDPELTVNMLHHIVEETPNDSDGAAVASMVAHYVVDMRTEGKQRDNLLFFSNNLLGSVARRHSDVESQEQFNFWVEKLELNDPAKFLPRLRNVIDVMVQDDWWIDRDAIWATLPDQ
jgi:hypothetical protein